MTNHGCVKKKKHGLACQNVTKEPSEANLVKLLDLWSAGWKQRGRTRAVECALSPGVKTRSNSFHSTLEPNTEVFSKVSRSLAQFTLVNSFSTLLNKGGSTCNCPSASQDF